MELEGRNANRWKAGHDFAQGNWCSSEYLMCDSYTLGDISEEGKTF